MGYHYPDGVAEGGAEVSTNDVSSSGSVIYVSNDGDDGNSGTRATPFLTLSAAVAAASAGDMIVMMEDYASTITSAVTINKALWIIGEGGTYGSDPSVELTLDHASNHMLNVSGNGVIIENVKFMESAQTASGNKVQVTGDGLHMRGCYFAQGATDQGFGVYMTTGNDFTTMEDCYFVATSTTIQAMGGILSDQATHIRVFRCVFDGGTLGFEYAGASFENSPVSLWGFGNSMLRGADLSLSGIGAFGTSTSTGDARMILSW